MPELPEVETYRRYLEATSLHQPISDVYVEDTKLLTADYDTLLTTLRQRQLVGSRRIGKNLFVATDSPYWLHLHFGMTGDLAYYRGDEDTPRFARIVFKFANGFRLGFLCPRKFERVGLVQDVEAYLQRKQIAADALEISPEALAQVLNRKKAPIKPVLLDQRTVAGIGNWIVDEVLFQARVHPEQAAHTLRPDQIAGIHAAIQEVLHTAIEHEAQYGLFPTKFVIHARAWGASPYPNDYQHEQCPRCEQPIAQSRVGGRSTYYCSRCQVLPIP